MSRKLLFELPQGEPGGLLAGSGPADPAEDDIPAVQRRKTLPGLPVLSEREVVRHFNELAGRNRGLDDGPCVCGGLTMRHPPRAGLEAARLPGFNDVHPFQDPETAPSVAAVIDRLAFRLKMIFGAEEVSLEPAGDGQAELLALEVVREAFRDEPDRRTLLVAGDSYFQGAEAALGLGFSVEPLDWDAGAGLDLADRGDLAGLVLSNPNCFGRWVAPLDQVVDSVHRAGGLVINHARNAAGFLAHWKPGESGVDLVLFPLNGLFGVPHFGGGPAVTAVAGSGPAAGILAELGHGLGRPLGTNWLTALWAWVYLELTGWEGLRLATQDAVLAANYLQERIRVNLAIAGEGRCANQFAAGIPSYLADSGITVGDIARRLLDHGLQGPSEGGAPALAGHLSFEPTDSSTHEVLNQVGEAVGHVTIEVGRNLSLVKGSPHTTPVARPRMEEAVEALILTYTRGIVHTEDAGCGCQLCARG